MEVKPGETMRLTVLGIMLVLVSAALLLSACSTPAVRIETKEVKVPVAVQPIQPKDVPPAPAPLPPRPASLSAAADVLFAKWCEGVAYFINADRALRHSAGLPPQALPRYPECEKH